MEFGLDVPFDVQFSNTQTVDLSQGRVRIVDVVPPQLVDSTPILIAPGWSEDPQTYKKTLEVFYKQKRRGISFAHLGRGTADIEMEGYPEVELRKAQDLLSVMELREVGQVDGVFHSEGAINGLIAATLYPERFRNIVLDKPAGIVGKDGNARLTGRFTKLLLKEAFERKPFSFTDPTNSVSSVLRTGNYLARHRELFTELSAMTTQDITEMMYNLEEKGIMFAIIAGPSDPLFPVARQLEHLRQVRQKKDKKLPFEGYYSVRGGHNELSIHAKDHALLAVDALTNLQRRRERLSKEA